MPTAGSLCIEPKAASKEQNRAAVANGISKNDLRGSLRKVIGTTIAACSPQSAGRQRIAHAARRFAFPGRSLELSNHSTVTAARGS